MLKKYKNPFRILYLWAVQETLEVQSLLEAMKLKDDLEEKRRKMMRKIKMTNAELDTMRLSRSTNVKDIFSGDVTNMSQSDIPAATFDAQKDIVLLMMINEMLTNYLATRILPRFRYERRSKLQEDPGLVQQDGEDELEECDYHVAVYHAFPQREEYSAGYGDARQCRR
eukprot:CAMPEP_0170454670 /NCGR_PEP_ID=MMETSP0123-20130129/2843_1 /TAXON_ID=182087 /ORGANISM="Favella ehrenbergii, Strain Fehren 1" /LENGTH=168 /DNA_ID=CAMNT_0010717457 /DNA_START=1258 /DNA_END=1763 /DNA_ORIENTATION=-